MFKSLLHAASAVLIVFAANVNAEALPGLPGKHPVGMVGKNMVAPRSNMDAFERGLPPLRIRHSSTFDSLTHTC